MEGNFDSWLNGTLHMSRSHTKENLQKSNSTQIVGKKLNLYQKLFPKNSSSNKPTVIERPLSTQRSTSSRTRPKSLSKSPLRSISQRRRFKVKDHSNDIPHSVSPPRQTRNLKTIKRAHGKLIKPSASKKMILIESQNKNYLDLVETQKKPMDEKLKKETLKDKSKKTKKPKQKATKTSKRTLQKHNLATVYDQRLPNDHSHSKSAENDDMRTKSKSEHENSKKQRRKVIEINLYPQSKKKTKIHSKEEKPKPKRSPESARQKGPKSKSKSRKTTESQKHLEDVLKEHEKLFGFEKLDKTIRKKHTKNKRRNKSKDKSKYIDDKSTEIINSSTRVPRNKSKSERKKKRKTTDLISDRIKDLEERVCNNYDTMKTDAALKIQRWYRNLNIKKQLSPIRVKNDLKIEDSEISTDKYLGTECEEWISILNPSSKYKDNINDQNNKLSAKKDEKQINTDEENHEKKTGQIFRTVSGYLNEFSELTERNVTNSINAIDNSSLKIPLLSLSGLGFQTKRPKELDIDSINIPLVSHTYESEDENTGRSKKAIKKEEISLKSGEKNSIFKKSSGLIEEVHESQASDSQNFYKSLTEKSSKSLSDNENTSLMIRKLQEKVDMISDSESISHEKVEILNESEDATQKNIEILVDMNGQIKIIENYEKEMLEIEDMKIEDSDKEKIENGIEIIEEKGSYDDEDNKEDMGKKCEVMVEKAISKGGDEIFFKIDDEKGLIGEDEENYSPLQEVILKSFHLENDIMSDKDSLEEDISQISSALMENKDKSAGEDANNQMVGFQGNGQIYKNDIEYDEEKYESNQDYEEVVTGFRIPLISCSTIETSEIPRPSIVLKKIEMQDDQEFPSDASLSDDYIKSKFSNCPISSPYTTSPRSNNFSEQNIPDIITHIFNLEIDNFIESISFKLKEKDVDPSNDFIEVYLHALLDELQKNEPDMLELINTPAYQDPLTRLMILQNTEVGELSKFPKLELILPFDISARLKFKLGCNTFPYRSIYLQMMFDCINEALNHVRPFGLKGIPDPWASEPRMLFGDSNLNSVFHKLLFLLNKWASIKGGAFPNQDLKEEEDKLNILREERMNKLLSFDINNEEPWWVAYNDEETQSKVDIGDFILEDLVDEIITIFQ